LADRALTGVLLVGGASRRFGSPKALASFEGETLAARAWRTLGAACGTCIAVGKAADALSLPFPLIDDGASVRAPLAGIVAGLRAATAELVVVMPVDVPLVRTQDLACLAAACADAAVPQTGPLPCALRRSVSLPHLEQALGDGRLALKEVFAALDTRVVEIDPGRLANVNEPKDLDVLQVRIAPFAPEHLPGYRSLVSDTLREFGFTPDDELDPDLVDPSVVYEGVWTATVPDEVVGSIAVRRTGPRSVELKRMYVRPRFRGRGVGRRLLAMALVWAKEHGIETMTLDTTEEMQAARHLYEEHGFRRVAGDAPRQGQQRLLYELRL
jgi:molybdopterin-guanine dinucleotide biosynthesis protein A